MNSYLEKNTSEISAMKGQIALKVEQADIENAISEVEGVIDTKIDSAKAEIKVTTDTISQNVSNLSQTVSTKADGSTVTTLSNKVGSLETSVNGISGKVTNLEKTTTTLGTQVSDVQDVADSAINKANSAQSTANTANSTANANKGNITNLQGEVSTIKSDVAELEVTTSGITQKVESVESTTTTLTTQVTTAQNIANQAKTDANNANNNATNALNKAETANTLADSKAKVFVTTPTTPYKIGDLWVQGSSGDVMKCKTSRTSGSYSASDWEKASKYTDDTKANAVDGKVTTLQGEYNTTKSKVASLETNLDGITQRVSSTESTTVTLTEKVNTAQSTADSAKTTATNAQNTANTANTNASNALSKAESATAEITKTNQKVSSIETNLGSITSRVSSVETKATTLEGKVASQETRLSTAESKITNDAIINTVSSTIDSKVNMGISNLKFGGRNYIKNGKGDQKDGFFKNFNKVGDGYGEHTLTSQKTYSNVDIAQGFILGCRDYEVGKQVTFSYEIMYTDWDFPSGTNRSEFWIGQRYTNSSTSTDGQWRGVTQHNLPVVGENGCKLNEWFKVEKTLTIPSQADSSIGTASSIQFYNSNADISASVTFRIRNVKIEYGNKATDYTDAPEDVDNVISNTEKILNENIDNAVSSAKDDVLKNIGDNYTAKDEFTSFSQTVNSKFEQTSKDITATFTNAQNYTKEVDGKLQEFQDTVGTYIRFSENGIDLGKTNSPFTATLDNTKLAFKQDGTEVAYISNNKMYITHAEIKDSLRIGKSNSSSTAKDGGFFTWIQGEKGNLSLKWSEK